MPQKIDIYHNISSLGNVEKMNTYFIMPMDDYYTGEIAADMSDHDMLVEHVTQGEGELYYLDCCMGEIFGQ